MIRLDPGDKIASVTAFRDYLVVVSERGVIYRLRHDAATDELIKERVR